MREVTWVFMWNYYEGGRKSFNSLALGSHQRGAYVTCKLIMNLEA